MNYERNGSNKLDNILHDSKNGRGIQNKINNLVEYYLKYSKVPSIKNKNLGI